MSQTIKLPNFSTNNLHEGSRLALDANIGDTTLTLQNTQGFTHSDFILVGPPSQETSEIVVVNAITSASVLSLVSALKLGHPTYEIVYSLSADTINVYRAADVNGIQPADGSFTLLGNVQIEADQDYTLYTDSTGGSGYWYKYTFLNSVSLVESNIADSKSSRGGGSGSYCTIQDIREEAGFVGAAYITDEMIDRQRRAAEDEINGSLHAFYVTPFQTPINAFISNITARLAAGLLLLEQYGSQISSNSNANGQAKIDNAREDIVRIQLKEVVLTDTTGTSTALAGSVGGASTWPNATTNVIDPATGMALVTSIQEGQDGGHSFKMQDLMGYYGRKY